MSIINITVITKDDYVEYQPNSATKYTDNEINSAIYLTHTLLDAECGGAITDRWEKTSTETGYLTETQKLHIKKAYLIETQYVLMNGLDFSQGNDQFSLGSFNMSSNRPNRSLISPQALKELQLAGIWYQTDFVQARVGGSHLSLADEMNEPIWKDEPLPQSVSDARYIHKQAEQTGSYDKFLKYDAQGMISFVEGNLGGYWGSITGNINEQTDLQGQLSLKQRKVYYGETAPETANENDIWVYETSATPTGTFLSNATTSADVLTITKSNGQQVVFAPNSAIFRGTFEVTAAELADADTFIKAKMVELSIIPNKDDYVYLNEEDTYIYQKWQYNGTDKWEFVIEVDLSGSITVDMIYPVGSIYMSVNNVSPATIFTSTTWEPIKDRFLLSAGDTYTAGTYGGSADATLVSHSHTRGSMNITGTIQNSVIWGGTSGSASGAFTLSNISRDRGMPRDTDAGGAYVNFNASNSWTGSTSVEGESGTGKNLPPYLTVYMWKRTA